MRGIGVVGSVGSLGALVLGNDFPDDAIDLALRPALANELLDQNQILLTHASKVAAGIVTARHRSGNQVSNVKVW